MVNRIPTPQHSIESRITVQPYDERSDNDPQNPGAKFIEWIGKNSEKLFNRFVVYSLSNLQKLQQRDGKSTSPIFCIRFARRNGLSRRRIPVTNSAKR